MDASRTAKLTNEPAAASHGWVLTPALRNLWRTLREDCRAVPRAAWRRWATTLVLGFLACGLISHIVTRFARGAIDDGLQAWDERMLMKLVERGPFSFPNAVLLESPGNLAYLIPLTLAGSIIAIRRRAPLAALGIQAAYWLQRPIVLIGWQTWDRARPKLVGEGIAAPGLHSFPSGHAALCVAVYGFLGYLWIRSSRSAAEKVLVVVLVAGVTTVVSLARVRLGSHWPSDIIAGAVIGLAWLGVVIVAHRSATRASTVEQPV